MSNVVVLVEETTLDEDDDHLALAIDKTVLHPMDEPVSTSSSTLSRTESSTSGCSSSSSPSALTTPPATKTDFHLVSGKIRPTLKCIRNTLARGKVAEHSSKRYDRLSSSRSDFAAEDDDDDDGDDDHKSNAGSDHENAENHETKHAASNSGSNKRKESSRDNTSGGNKLKKMINEGGSKCANINNNNNLPNGRHQQLQSNSSSTTAFVGASASSTATAMTNVSKLMIVSPPHSSSVLVGGSVKRKSHSNKPSSTTTTTTSKQQQQQVSKNNVETPATSTVDIVVASRSPPPPPPSSSSFSLSPSSAVVVASSLSHPSSLFLPSLQLPNTQTFRSFIKTRAQASTATTSITTAATTAASASTANLESLNGLSETIESEPERNEDFQDEKKISSRRAARPKHHAHTCSSNSSASLVQPQLVTKRTSSLANPCHMAIYEHVDGPPPLKTAPLSSSIPTKSHHHALKPSGGALLVNKSRTLLPSVLKSSRFTRHVKGSGRSNSSGSLLFNGWSHHNLHKKTVKEVKRASVDNVYTDTNSPVQDGLKWERMLLNEPGEERRRRTILIEKQNGSFGFTLQTYGIKNAQEDEVESITYVDEVKYGGPAFRGGMRAGDVILSINGRDVEKSDHPTMVSMIKACEHTLRLVVLFEDCVRKIELHVKYLRAKKALKQKMTELEILEQRERQILLNAALRSCRLEEINQNDQEETSETSVAMKLHKCKSMEVSLEDIDCNQISEVNNNRKKNVMVTKKASSDMIQDDEEHLVDEESDCLDHWKVDTKTKKDTDESGSRSMVPASKSLPHSITNSLDCLTNEAYEDDEDELIKNSGETYYSNNESAPIGSTMHHELGTSVDKDFITKL